LVKSNSCSSRLELAGAEEGDGNSNMNHMTETEVVRKMVHHFECNQPTGDGNPNVTINSQGNVSKTATQEILEATARRQVTVNNHINVMPQESEMMLLMPPNGQQEEATTTYHSQAMNIRLELSALGSAGRGSDKPNNNSKVCRNAAEERGKVKGTTAKEGRKFKGATAEERRATKESGEVVESREVP